MSGKIQTKMSRLFLVSSFGTHRYISFFIVRQINQKQSYITKDVKLTSENHLENRLWELTSISWNSRNVSDIRIEALCARALHNEVLPVPKKIIYERDHHKGTVIFINFLNR